MSKYIPPKEANMSMKPMDRPLAASPEKFPKHSVPNSITNGHGITFSVEKVGETPDGQAEFEVLKAILNREGYLNRLHQVARTVGKKFKPEVADVLDLVRATSLDVIDTILRWREIKEDHDAAFTWNGVNYLLKMPSDLDYLSEYLAIKRWMGFSLIRNPFCVPYPMEEGVGVYTENLTNPKHIEKGRNTDGYLIGGITKSTLKKKYLSKSLNLTSHDAEESTNSPYLSSGISESKMNSTTRDSSRSNSKKQLTVSNASFVLNDDMAKIRQAELIILREEEKFGILGRDPDGRIMPRLQAMTRQAFVELKKDDHRPLTEPSLTSEVFAPHAAQSDVGVAPPNWTPSGDGNTAENNEKQTVFLTNSESKHLKIHDDSLLPKNRGEGKSGGLLAPLYSKGTESRSRRPLKTNLASDMEFKRTRNIRTLGEKLNEINQLKEQIIAEKMRLQQLEDEANNNSSEKAGSSKSLRPISRSRMNVTAYNNNNSSMNNNKKLDVVRSAISNQTYGNGSNNMDNAKSLKKDLVGILRSSSATSGMTVDTAASNNRSGTSEMNNNSDNNGGGDSNTSSAVGSPVHSTKRSVGGGGSATSTVTNVRAGDPFNKKVPLGRLGSSSKQINFQLDTDNNNNSNAINKTTSGDNLVAYNVNNENVDQAKQPVNEELVKLLQDKDDALKHLEDDRKITQQRLSHYVRDEEKIMQFKQQERGQNNRERSREIERKRRLLTEEEGRRKGPPPEDMYNVYDLYAIRVQSVIRGFLVRAWLRWYKDTSLRACMLIQAVMRGWFGRMRVRRIRQNAHAATTIQRNFRGWSTRGTSSAMAKKQNLAKAAIVIQRVWRGVLGLRRAISKRALDQVAKQAFECVDSKSIVVGDIKELARRVLYAIEEPHATSFPPDEVLYLIRLTVMVIQSARGLLGVAEYDFFHSRDYQEISGEELTWLQAAKMCNRSERFLRLIRVMAYGPGAKPPRLISLPPQANILFAAQAKNPKWTLSTFENMGAGSRICCKLFQWLSSIIEVASRQQEFLSLIATSFPDWLPKLFDLQKVARLNEFEIEINKKCMTILDTFKERNMDDDILLSILDKEYKLIKRASMEAKSHMKDLLLEIDKLKKDQSAREVYALIAMEQKLADCNVELDELAKTFQNTFRMANQGDRASIEALPEIRNNLTNLRLKVTELDAQKKLLEIQVEANRNKRKNPARLTPEITFRTVLAGESKAAYVIAQVKAKTMLRSSGVKHASDLPDHIVEVYEQFAQEEERCRAEARRLFVDADNERKQYDDFVSRSLTENELKEQKAKDRHAPTDLELQEERLEDEIAAKAEAKKHRQFLSDAVLLSPEPRPKPFIIALSRDLPLHAKNKLVTEITRIMPGLFITIDHKENMGLDYNAMQLVLDSKKCVIMFVDPGLTRTTRNSFLQNLEINVKALVPSPNIAIAMGDERNRRGGGSTGGAHYGVDKTDLSILRDGNIKISLEAMAWVVEEMSTPEIRTMMQKRAAELVPTSKSFVFVAEAFFIVISGEDIYKTPDETQFAYTWKGTRKLLVEPMDIVTKMKQIRRGAASLKLVECVKKYLEHFLWPTQYSKERSDDQIMHLFAYYVEQWLNSEKLSFEGDGVPLQALTKSTMSGIQAVVTVTDCIDSEDMIDSLTGNAWKMAAAKLVRASLQDMRVVKSIMKIDNIVYTVSVYRESNSIYFEAYEPITSNIYMTHVSVDDVPALLIPNGNGLDKGVDIIPPKTPLEMYKSLTRLLRFDKLSKNKSIKKELVCKREYTFMKNVTRRINGHLVLLKCYEAALGELFFTAYLPEYSAHVKLLVSDEVRFGMFANADRKEINEYQFVSSEDARPLLPYILDRLKLSPSKSMLQFKQLDLNDGYRKNQGLLSTIQRQGFVLKARIHGGAGRILLRRVTQFNKVPHLVEIRSSEPAQLLEIRLYEPRRRHTMSLRIPYHVRKLLLGAVNDDYHTWYDTLMKRLRINWRGDHSLSLDYTLFSSVKKISNRRVVMKFNVIHEDSEVLGVTLRDTLISESYSTTLTKEDVIQILFYTQPVTAAIDKSRTKETIANNAIKEILQSMKQEYSTVHHIVTKESNPELFLITFEELLTNKNTLQYLANQMEFILQLRDPTKLVLGYNNRVGNVTLELLPDSTGESGIASIVLQDKSQPLTTDLRYTERLKQGERYGDLTNVIRARKQMIIVHMEDELNMLAYHKSQQATQQVDVDKQAAQVIDEHVTSQNLDVIELDEVIGTATKDVTTQILDNIQEKLITRFVERQTPGQHQVIYELKKQAELEEERRNRKDPLPIDDEDMAIVGREWKPVFEAGVKTNYRDGKVRWHGHVSVKIMSADCWVGDEGAGRRYKFIVYEPVCAAYFEGIIRSKKHLREILSLSAQDLIDIKKEKEMLLYVCKYRMDVVLNRKTWDGEDVPEGAPKYRIEFQSDRLFGVDKVTPVNAAAAEDEEANKEKLIDMENARGKKIVRLVRRVSGLLMQLTVFDLPTEVVQASEAAKSAAASVAPPSATSNTDNRRGSFTSIAKASSLGDDNNMDGNNNEPAVKAASRRASIKSTDSNMYAELRDELHTLTRYTPPAFRIVGYDPRSKRKSVLTAEPQAIVEVAGGVLSPYLNPEKRRDLAKVVCDSLVLNFPSGRPPELVIPWSGATKEISTAVVSKDETKISTRSSAERVVKRPGKIFRSAMKISKYELIVSLYQHQVSNVTGAEESNPNNNQLIFNFYSTAVSEASEVVVSEAEQIERIGRTILNYPEGTQRAAAIRRFCGFFRAEIIEDILDPKIKTLHVAFLPPGKDFITDYQQVSSSTPGEDIRPVGIPGVFFPLDTCGNMIHRIGMNLRNRDKKKPSKDFLITVYTKSMNETPERGLVIKLYDRSISTTSILHLGPSELIRICEFYDEPDLLRDMVQAKDEELNLKHDEIDEGFSAFTVKGELEKKTLLLVNHLVDIILNDLGFFLNPLEQVVPYMKSAPKGIPPN